MHRLSAATRRHCLALGMLAAACGSSTTPTAGVQQYVTSVTSANTMQTAVLMQGTPPTGAGPSATVNSSGAAIAGAAQYVQLGCSTNCTSVAVAVQGVDGYYALTGLPDPATQNIIVYIAQSATQTFSLLFAVGTGSSFGATTTLPVTLTAVGSGDVEISLSWGAPTDLDLHVVEPSGEEIYWGNKTSATGGMLDLDSNAACTIDNIDAEHVTWPGVTPPTGTYQVIVDPWSLCSVSPPINYTVIVNVKGRTPQVFSGSFSTDDMGSACWVATGQPLNCPSANLVTSFSYP